MENRQLTQTELDKNQNKIWEQDNATYRDFIGIYDNPWNHETQRLSDELVRWFDISADYNWTLNSQTEISIPRTLREDEVLFPIDLLVEQHIPRELLEVYWDGLRRCLSAYVAKYALTHSTLQHKTFKIHKVLPTQGYHVWHSENPSSLSSDRILAYSTYLKVPEDGGETEFRHQSYRVKPVVGRTLIWPAGFTHTHRGNPPLDGEKYYITGWFCAAPEATRFETTEDLAQSWV